MDKAPEAGDADQVGWSPNWIQPADDMRTDPIGGEYAWSDTKVKVKKVEDSAQAVRSIGLAAAALGTAHFLSKSKKNGEEGKSDVGDKG
ncbi:MAG: hypothetical protein ACE5E0_00675 [Terriglobia bacterium]